MAATAEELINSAQTAAAQEIVNAKAYTDSGVSLASQEAILPTFLAGGSLAKLSPPGYDPSLYLTTAWNNDFEAIWKEMENWLQGLMDGWLAEFFPQLSTCIPIQEDAWLCDVIMNGYSGISVTVETQIWERSRARELIEANRLEDEAVSTWAARGFSVPQGALLAQVYAAQTAAQDKASTASREAAIKHLDIQVHMTEVAIDNMTKLRLGVAQALADLIRGVMMLPQAAADAARAKWELDRYLRESAAAYYQAMVAELRTGVDFTLGIDKLILDQNVEQMKSQNFRIDRQVDSAMKAAGGMAQIAASTLGAQNTLVGALTTITTATKA